MKVDVKNWDNETVGEIELPDEVFAKQINEHIVWEVVRAHLAGIRRGTHKAKERSDVKGAGGKPWRQKHTGRARAGDRRSPLWRHGGVVHGPQPRSYAMKVNKKVRKAALAGALSQRASQGRLLVLKTMELDEPKTKALVKYLQGLGIQDEKVLLLDGFENLNLHLASRNRPELRMLPASSLNAYEVLNHRWIIASEPAVLSLAEVLS